MRETGLPALLRRSTTAAAFVVAMVVSLLPAPTLAANNDLLNASVTPDSGTTATVLTFQVDYVGEPANGVSARLTGVAHGVTTVPLGLVSGESTAGTYRGTARLAADTWTVQFRADAATQNDPVENLGTLVISPQPTPTPAPTATPRPGTPRPTARPTATPRPIATPTLPPGATPRPPTAPPPAGTPGSGGAGGSPVAASAGASNEPSGTGETLGGNPTPSAAGGGVDLPSSGSADPNVEETSDTESTVGVGRVVMLAVGGTLAVSGASYLTMLTLRRRARMNGGPDTT